MFAISTISARSLRGDTSAWRAKSTNEAASPARRLRSKYPGAEVRGSSTGCSRMVVTPPAAAASSTTGYGTVGPIVARAAVQCGILNLSRANVLTFDPFASTNPLIGTLLEHLDTLGVDLASEVKDHLHRQMSIVTAAGAKGGGAAHRANLTQCR